MGCAEKLGVWVSYELSKNNKENRLQIASQHLTRHQATHSHKQRFLYQIVMGDEKWCLYINMKQRKEWVAPGDTSKLRVNPDLQPRKTMSAFGGLGGHGALRNAQKECHGQQGALHSPATLHE